MSLMEVVQMIFNLLTKAKELFYKNTVSGLEATNVQDAIDELSEDIGTLNQSLEQTSESLSNVFAYSSNPTINIDDLHLQGADSPKIYWLNRNNITGTLPTGFTKSNFHLIAIGNTNIAIEQSTGISASRSYVNGNWGSWYNPNQSLQNKVLFKDIDVGGTVINNPDNNAYYSNAIKFTIPSGAHVVGAFFSGVSFSADLNIARLDDNSVILTSRSSITLPAYRMLRIVYTL